MAVYLFDGKGGVREVEAKRAAGARPAHGFLAVVGNAGDGTFQTWVRDQLGEIAGAQFNLPDAHSRCIVVDDRATLVLRVAKRGAQPDEIGRLSLTIWMEKGRVVVSAPARLPELFSFAQWQQSRHAPVSAADLVARMALKAVDRLEPFVERVGNEFDDLEEQVIDGRSPGASARLARARRSIILLRRIVWPQRDVLTTLEIEDLSFLTDRDRAHLHEATLRTTRLGDELQALAERGALVHEQLLDSRGEQMNRTILVLTSVTVIAMPMTVVSGLLGMNVAGIPFAQNPTAFWIVVLGLAALGTGMVWFMRKRKWL